MEQQKKEQFALHNNRERSFLNYFNDSNYQLVCILLFIKRAAYNNEPSLFSTRDVQLISLNVFIIIDVRQGRTQRLNQLSAIVCQIALLFYHCAWYLGEGNLHSARPDCFL